MPGYVIDTNVAIDLRDGEAAALGWLDALHDPPMLSVVSLVELENGVYAHPHHTAKRRAALDELLIDLELLDFTASETTIYAEIVTQVGFARSRTFDRMIAATALVHDLTLVTRNPRDFADIKGLAIESW